MPWLAGKKGGSRRRGHRESIASSRDCVVSMCQAAMAGSGVELVLGVRDEGVWGLGPKRVGVRSEWSDFSTKIKQEITVYSCMTVIVLA